MRPKCFLFWKSFVIVLTPLVFSPLLILSGSKISRCGYAVLILAVYWVTEAVPLAVTSLVPVFAFPLLGLLSTSEVCEAYLNTSGMMFLGSLMAALALESSQLHKRIALLVLLKIGSGPRRLLAGFIFTTGFFSIWVANVATITMMMPIIDQVILELVNTVTVQEKKHAHTEENEQETAEPHVHPIRKLDSSEDKTETLSELENSVWNDLRKMCFLATAYSANIGGTGSPTGGSTNMVTKSLFESTFREATSLTYASWVIFSFPGVVLNLFFVWIWLQFLYIGFGKKSKVKPMTEEGKIAFRKALQKKYSSLGRTSSHEILVIILFSILVLLWITRRPGFMPGWAEELERIFGEDIKISDATSTMFIVFMYFVLPTKINFTPLRKEQVEPSESCLTWDVVHKKVHWGVLLLLGAGISMAKAADKSGLSVWMGENLGGLRTFPAPVVVLLTSLLTAMVTEIVSNTAAASILMPVLKEMSLGSCINPLYTIVPATSSCLYAFMLPAATPTNALAHSAGRMKTSEMVKAGIVMNIISVAIANIMINSLGVLVYDVHNMPSWANSTTGNNLPNCGNFNYTDS